MISIQPTEDAKEAFFDLKKKSAYKYVLYGLSEAQDGVFTLTTFVNIH